jgi:hypothetical protein
MYKNAAKVEQMVGWPLSNQVIDQGQSFVMPVNWRLCDAARMGTWLRPASQGHDGQAAR